MPTPQTSTGTLSNSPTQNPCAVGQSAVSINATKKHKHSNGTLSQFFLLLLQFLLNLLQQLLGITIQLPSLGNPMPTSVPPTSNPGVTSSPVPTSVVTPGVTINPCTTPSTQPNAPTLTTQPQATPTSAIQPTSQIQPTNPPTTVGMSIKVVGNHLVNQNGAIVQLRGVNRSGTQYMCMDGNNLFDGPGDDASIQKMKAWGINAVRVNLNEDCWLGINGAVLSGTVYHQGIGDFVNRLNAQGLYVIVDMHHSAPGSQKAQGQQPMPDQDHAPAYWSSVASFFQNDHAVLFDLYNEPYPDNNNDTVAAWTCVRDGGNCPGVPFTAAGMQELVNAVRAAGATNPIMIGGPQYAGTLSRWIQYKPNDPANQLVASVHIYGQPLGAPYDNPSTWDPQIAPVAQQVPIVMGEIGDTDCTHNFIDQLMPWADQHGISYFAWSWIVGNCSGEPSLITDYNGTPSNYGIGYHNHLISLPH